MNNLKAGTMREYIAAHMEMAKLLTQLFRWRMKLWYHQQAEIISRADAVRFKFESLVNDPNLKALQAQTGIGGPAGTAATQVCR